MNKKFDLTNQKIGNWEIIEQAANKNGNIMWLCQCKCGEKKILQGSMLRRGESKGCRKCRDTKNIRSRYGRLIVIGEAGYKKFPSGVSKLTKCLCDCGKTITVLQSTLVTGNTKSCGCLKLDKLRSRSLPNNEVVENLAIHTMKRNAINRNLVWGLTRDQAITLITKRCYYCGILPSNQLKYYAAKIFLYNGIDRVNSEKGYVEGNVVPCCKICNWAKQKMSEMEFLTWIERIYERTIRNPRIKLMEPTVTNS